jgi:hypothetical protein
MTKTIKREFTVDPRRGAACMLAGSTAEGLPLVSMTRKGDKVVCVYGGEPDPIAQDSSDD